MQPTLPRYPALRIRSLIYAYLPACLQITPLYLLINSTSHYVGGCDAGVNNLGMVWLGVLDLVVCERAACVLGAWRVRVVSTELE